MQELFPEWKDTEIKEMFLILDPEESGLIDYR